MDEARKKHRARVFNALHEYYAKGADISDGNEEKFTRTLRDESDRGYVILLVSFLEDALLERILNELPHGQELRRSLLKGGPLRSIEHRMTLARAMGLLTQGDIAIFDVFREMRNACAHSRQEISFKTPELLETMALVLAPDTHKEFYSVAQSTARLSFEMCTSWMLARIHGSSPDDATQRVNKAISEAVGEDVTPIVKFRTSPGKPTHKPAPGRRPHSKGKAPRRPRQS